MQNAHRCSVDCSAHHQNNAAFYLQQVHGFGETEKHCCGYSLPVEWPDCPGHDLQLKKIIINGQIETNTKQSTCKSTLLIAVNIPVLMYFESCKKCYTLQSTLQESFPLRLFCADTDVWRYQLKVDAAIRLCHPNIHFNDKACCASLDMILQAYLLSGCVAGYQNRCRQGEAVPWYPHPSSFCR